MAEFPALQAAQTFALQTDARLQRELQEQNRARVEATRQNTVDLRNNTAVADARAKQLKLDQLRQDQRAADDLRNRQRQQRVDRESQVADQRRTITLGDAADHELKVNDVTAQTRFVELQRQGLDQPAQSFAPAAPAANEPNPNDQGNVQAPGVADVTQSSPTPDQVRLGFFEQLQQEREARLAERRQVSREALIQQQLDLQLSQDRINSTPPNPNLARGSIVDVTG